MIVAQVEFAQTDQSVVDERGPFQFVAGEVERPQVPLVRRVVLVQQLDAVGGGDELPKGTRQVGGQVAQPVVRQIEDAEVRVRGELPVQVVKSVVGQVQRVQVVLQAVGQLPQTPPGAAHLPVAAAAGAHVGAHGEDKQPRKQHEQGEAQQHTSAENKKRTNRRRGEGEFTE